MVNMRSNIIVVRKIKEKLHIVLRWRQLENGRLRRYVDSIERLEIWASHDCMRCSCDMRNINFVPDHDQQVRAFWQTVQETAMRDLLKDLAKEHDSSLMAIYGASLIKLLTAGSRSTFGNSFVRLLSRLTQA